MLTDACVVPMQVDDVVTELGTIHRRKRPIAVPKLIGKGECSKHLTHMHACHLLLGVTGQSPLSFRCIVPIL